MDKLRQFARWPFRLLQAMFHFLALAGRFIGRVLRPFLGKLSWQAPAWLQVIAHQINRLWQLGVRHQARASLVMTLALLLAVGAALTVHWYNNRPAPAYIKYQVIDPPLTNYQASEVNPMPVTINFNSSVAPLELSGKELPSGLITLKPEHPGAWRYANDRRLIFTPSQDWPAGRKYEIHWQADKIFASHVLVDKSQPSFSTAVFAIVALNQVNFQQDQKDPNIRKAVFELGFTHPLDLASVQKRITLTQTITGSAPQEIPFTLSTNDKRLNAVIVSDNIKLQDLGSQVQMKLQSGVMPAIGGEPLSSERTAAVQVPSIYGLKLERVEPLLVDNEDYSTDQLLSLQFNQRLTQQEVKQGVQAYVLPAYKTEDEQRNQQAHSWSLSDIDDKTIIRSKPLSLSPLENPEEYAQVYNFKFQANPGQYLLVKVAKGLEAFGGYLLGEDYYSVVKTPNYAAKLNLVGSGALLALSGEQRLTIVGRNLDNAYVELARLQPAQLHHLAALSGGSFAEPSLYLSPDNISDRFETTIAFTNRPEPQYKGLDLAPWLKDKNQLGVFLLRLSNNKDALRHDSREYRRNSDTYDARLIVVSDLGLLLKQEQNGACHVFVQSIHSGQPVAGAKVQLMAINGKVLQESITGEDGHTFFAKLDNYMRELKPIMFLAQKGSDTNFLPMGGQQMRFLNYSRFDVGGESIPQDKGQLRAHMFSERGLYRPGDTINLGAIVRDYAWSKDLNGLPVAIQLTDASGRVAKQQFMNLNDDGFVEFSHSTQPSSPTGAWHAGIYLVEKNKSWTMLGSTSVQVQEFEPDTMKVKAQLNKQKEQGWVSPEDIEGLVNVQNMFGTPAQNRRVEASISLQPTLPRFSKYAGYIFHDPTKNSKSWSEQLTPMQSDLSGQATFKLNLAAFAEASFQLTFMAQAYEAQGGRSVSAMASTLVSPCAYLVGSKADGNLDFINRQAVRKINFIAVDSDLKLVEAKQLKLSLIEHKYVSVLTRQGSGLYKYESHEKQNTLWEKELSVGNRGLDYNLPTEQPGRYSLIVSNEQGQIMNRINFSVAGTGNISRSLERNAELELTLNKSSYAPGEEIKVAIRAPYAGSGLITIEKDKLYAHAWFKADTTSSVQTITLPAGIEGNAYVNVQFIRDPGSDEVFMSPLSYAVKSFNINREQRTLAFKMQAPSLLKPGQDMNIKLTSPHKGTALVFVVDEGILQVARYSLADPLQTFFSKQALQVRTAQLLDLIMPEFQKLLHMSAPGGGMAELSASRMLAENLNPFQRIREAPVVYWSGLVEVDKEATLTWQVPDYFSGGLKVMAVMVNRDSIGVAQSSCLVRGDFVLTPSLPGTVAPGDEFIMSLNVASTITGASEIPVNVVVESSDNLRVLEGGQQTLNLRPNSENHVLIKVKAGNTPGAATIKSTASWQEKQSTRTLGVSIRPVTPFTTSIRTGQMQATEQRIENLRPMYEEFASRSMWLGYTPLVLMQGLNGFLSYYPHQCSEQLASQAYSGLVMARHPALAELLSNKINLPQINRIIETLHTRQNSSGVIGSYMAATNEEPFVTAYVVQFLLEAKAQGIELPQNMLNSANAYLHNLAGNQYYSNIDQLRLRCFAIYLLTRQGIVTSNYLAQVQETLNQYYKDAWPTDLSAAYIASSFKLMRQDEQASKLMSPLWKRVNQAQSSAVWQGMYDPLAQNAVLVYLAGLHFPELKVSAQALENMAQPLAKGELNTISAAMTLLALDGYAQQIAPSSGGGLSLSQLMGDGKQQALGEAKDGMLSSSFSGQANALLLNNSTQLPAWYSMLQAGYNNKLPEKAISNGMEILREYYDRAGKPLLQASLGQEVVVRLKMRTTGTRHVDDLVVVELLPGGFELVRNSDLQGNWQPYYADKREDRIVLYGGIGPSISEYVYVMKAANRGDFMAPPAYAESMYTSAINATSAPGAMLQVITPVE